jgi:hypothetical protein
MTSINVGKGMFRLWIVLATSWVAWCGYAVNDKLFAIKKQPDQLDAECVKIKTPASNKYEVHCKYNNELIKFEVDLTGPPVKSVSAIDKQTISEILNAIRPEVFYSFQPDWPSRIEAAQSIIIPPSFLILFGFAMAWIARGFRTSGPPMGE